MRHIPNVDMFNDKIPETKIKSYHIMDVLADYGADSPRDAIRIIEEQGVDKFDFDYPYGSFEEYKKHVLAGEFDAKIRIMTPERRKELKKAVDEGKLWITY